MTAKGAQARVSKPVSASGGAKVPWPVVAASALFALLAAVWLAVTLADVKPGDSLRIGPVAPHAVLAADLEPCRKGELAQFRYHREGGLFQVVE